MRVTHEQRIHFPKDAIVSQEGRADYLLVIQQGRRLMSATFKGNWAYHLEHTTWDLVVVIKYWEC